MPLSRQEHEMYLSNIPLAKASVKMHFKTLWFLINQAFLGSGCHPCFTEEKTEG